MRAGQAFLIAVITFALLPAARPSFSQDPVPGLRTRAAPSIVKIVGKGTTTAGREVPFEGTGVVVATHSDVSVIITAAHVLGAKTSWRPKDNGEPDQDVKVWVKRSPTSGLEPLPLPPNVLAQDDVNDYAILLVHGEFPALEVGNPLQLAQGSQALVVGYPRGSYNLGLDDGRAQILVLGSLGLVLQLSDMQTSAGQSGGPILDYSGRILGLLRGGLGQSTDVDLAVPITTILPALQPYYPSTIRGPAAMVGTRDTISVEGSVRLEISGTGGGDFGRTLRAEARLSPDGTAVVQSAKVGDEVSISAKGGERSECREDSGRTVSSAQAAVSVLRAAENTLMVNVDLYAHGGHYRTAAGCLGNNPVGLTGHDTSARSSATVEGSLRIPVLDERTRALKLSFEGLPQAETRIEVIDPDGAVIMRVENRSGEQDFSVDKRGVYLVRLSMHPKAEAAGGFGDQRTRFSARLRAERIAR